MKCNFWVLNSKNTFEEKKGKVEDGVAIIGDKKYIVDDLEPFTVLKKTFLKKKPIKYYLLDWKSLKPLKLDIEGHKFSYDKINPKVFKSITENELLFGLLRRKSKLTGDSSAIMKYMMIGIIAGAFVMYFMINAGLIHIAGA